MTVRVANRPVVAAALAVTMVVALVGCAPVSAHPPVHRSIATVVGELKSIPGVTDAQFTGGSTGTPSQVEIGAGISLDPGYSNDIPALVDYVLRELWSQRQEQPTTNVTLGISRGTGDAAVFLDLAGPAGTLGLDDVGARIFAVDVGQMTKKYGPWPGPVPDLPASLSAQTVGPTP